MKKLLITIWLVFALSIFVACAVPSEVKKEAVGEDNISTSIGAIMPSESHEYESQTTVSSYTIHHAKDGTSYEVDVMYDSSNNYKLQLLDSKHNKLQSIQLDSPILVEIDFIDVNCDGYTDIVINTGGTLNETHELYIWSNIYQKFNKVDYYGFEMLSAFEVKDGYIMNWVKDSAFEGIVQKLVWNENTLSLESEEWYKLDELDS